MQHRLFKILKFVDDDIHMPVNVDHLTTTVYKSSRGPSQAAARFASHFYRSYGILHGIIHIYEVTEDKPTLRTFAYQTGPESVADYDLPTDAMVRKGVTGSYRIKARKLTPGTRKI